jgi:tetratricopeptide (TPR) repeat protein
VAAASQELDRLLKSLPEDRALDRAYASLELAVLHNDRMGALRGLEQVVAASPGDTDARYRLAQVYTQARRYSEAAEQYLVLAEGEPSNASYWNEAAYAQAYGEDRGGAIRSLERYRAAAPDDPNAEDSLGDVSYFFADFQAAAEHYEAAYKRDPKLNLGFSQFKAAWAWLQAGDLNRADEAANRYVGDLRNANPQLADLRSAQWQYIRGRREEARSAAEAMRGQQGTASPAFASLLASQLYIWDAVEQGAPALRFQGGARYGTAVRPVVAALAQALSPHVPSTERTAVIARLIPAQQQPAVVAAATYLTFERENAHTAQTLSILQNADAAVAESRAMFTHAVLGWAFAQAGDHDSALKIFTRRIPPVSEDDGLLWPLVFPRSLQWELQSAERAGRTEQAEWLRNVIDKLSLPATP